MPDDDMQMFRDYEIVPATASHWTAIERIDDETRNERVHRALSPSLAALLATTRFTTLVATRHNDEGEPFVAAYVVYRESSKNVDIIRIGWTESAGAGALVRHLRLRLRDTRSLLIAVQHVKDDPACNLFQLLGGMWKTYGDDAMFYWIGMDK